MVRYQVLVLQSTGTVLFHISLSTTVGTTVEYSRVQSRVHSFRICIYSCIYMHASLIIMSHPVLYA